MGFRDKLKWFGLLPSSLWGTDGDGGALWGTDGDGGGYGGLRGSYRPLLAAPSLLIKAMVS